MLGTCTKKSRTIFYALSTNYAPPPIKNFNLGQIIVGMSVLLLFTKHIIQLGTIVKNC